MRWRQVIVLYAVAAGLGVDYWLVERGRQAPVATRPVRQRFLAVARDDVHEVRLVRGGRAIVSRRVDGRWTVVEPADAPIPADLVPEASGDPAAYGLDATAARVELVVERGSPVVVAIGAPNATGTAVYARRGDAPAVVLIGRNVRYYEDLLFEALPPAHIPADAHTAPVGG
jgi:Domain of unknown function (DUF4340)